MDALTGLPGREALEEALQGLRGRSYSFIFVDLDGLKEVNDREGHRAGDDLIRRAADALRTAVRDSDVVVRLGGDEFAVILPGAGDVAAGTVLRAIGTGFRLRGVSASAGAATAGPDEEPTKVLERADAEMYRRKGRRLERRQLLQNVGEAAGEMIGGGVRMAEPSDLLAVQRFVAQKIGGTAISLPVRRRWYEAYPRSLWVMRRGRAMVGVFMYLPLRLEALEALRDGILREPELGAEYLDPGGPGAHVVVLAASGPREGARLLFRATAELSGYGWITALADTDAGAVLCQRFGFREEWERDGQRFYEVRMAR